jgi:ATP-binding cassette subfamily C protein
VASRWYFRHAPSRYRAERERTAAFTARIHETYAGTRALRLYRATVRARRRVLHAGNDVVDANMATTDARNRFRSALQLAQAAALLSVLIAGTLWVGNGSISIGAVSASAIYLTRLIDPVTVVLEQVDLLQRATASLARVVGISTIPTLDARRPTALHKASTPGTPANTTHPVELVNVTFGYRAGHPVLHDITMNVRRGERLAIIGASGAGKSTLAKLISRAHHPDHGLILVNGTPIEHHSAEQLRHAIALVVQEPHTFARSVLDNVRLANPALTRTEVEHALTVVGAEHWAMHLPDALDTIVGPGHLPLTAPQQQQLALARLVAADPDIVILDEATADLDPITAASTEHHLYAALHGRTIITIAHRLDAITTADRIAILHHGHLAGVGTHTALLEENPTYRQLWNTWNETSGQSTTRCDVQPDVGPQDYRWGTRRRT